jgi:hypothetical protein
MASPLMDGPESDSVHVESPDSGRQRQGAYRRVRDEPDGPTASVTCQPVAVHSTR